MEAEGIVIGGSSINKGLEVETRPSYADSDQRGRVPFNEPGEPMEGNGGARKWDSKQGKAGRRVNRGPSCHLFPHILAAG